MTQAIVHLTVSLTRATAILNSLTAKNKKKKLTLSANIRAPASMTNSEDSSSLTTAAVRPAALDALPEVYTALMLNSSICLQTIIIILTNLSS